MKILRTASLGSNFTGPYKTKTIRDLTHFHMFLSFKIFIIISCYRHYMERLVHDYYPRETSLV